MAHRKFTYVDFSQEHPSSIENVSRAAYITAADNQDDFFRTQDGSYFEVHQNGTIDSLLFAKGAQGWSLPTMGASNDGIEITQGIQATTTPMSFTVGTDGPFALELRVDLPDVSDLDPFFVGFRGIEDYDDSIAAIANLDNYTHLAGLTVNPDAGGTTSEEIGTAIKTTGTAFTDANLTSAVWADGEENSLRVEVSAAGVVTFKVTQAGAAATTLAAPTGAPTFTLASGTVVIPCIICIASAAADSPILVSYKCGIGA